jgi:hypothetical protein
MFLFIVGTGRNGSKLLRKMLSQHPKFGILMESHYLPMLINKFGNKEISAKDFYNYALEHYGSNKQRWLYTIAVFGNCRVSKLKSYIASEIKKSEVQSIADHHIALARFIFGDQVIIFGDKTPSYGQYANKLHITFKNARFIHLQRDGVFAAKSMTKHQGFVKVANGLSDYDQVAETHYRGKIAEFPDDPISLERAAELFNSLQSRTIKALSQVPQENILNIRYEDLLTDPENKLDEISIFTNIHFSKYFKKKSAALVRSHAINNMGKAFKRDRYIDLYKRVSEINNQQGYNVDFFDWYNNVRPYRRNVFFSLFYLFKFNWFNRKIIAIYRSILRLS